MSDEKKFLSIQEVKAKFDKAHGYNPYGEGMTSPYYSATIEESYEKLRKIARGEKLEPQKIIERAII